jgi:UDP-N-acetylmuramoyl-tripeptide--D-alanyl-D-alanine ligase
MIHRPTVITVGGSINKTFVKEEIRKVLEKNEFTVRANPRSFNTEIGLPLAVLYLPSGYHSYWAWLSTIKKALKRIWQKNFPRFLVLELGVSNPGDMKYLLSIVKPKIAIITEITQRYLESFNDMDELVDEYKYLGENLGVDNYLILNYDNPRVREIAKLTKAKIIFLSLENKQADWRATKIKKDKNGLLINVIHQNQTNQYRISRFGEHHVYALLSGLAIEEIIIKND